MGPVVKTESVRGIERKFKNKWIQVENGLQSREENVLLLNSYCQAMCWMISVSFLIRHHPEYHAI